MKKLIKKSIIKIKKIIINQILRQKNKVIFIDN